MLKPGGAVNHLFFILSCSIIFAACSSSVHAQTIFSGKVCSQSLSSSYEEVSIVYVHQNVVSVCLSGKFCKRDKLDIHRIEPVYSRSSISSNVNNFLECLVELFFDNRTGLTTEA